MTYSKKEFEVEIDAFLAQMKETLIGKGHDYTNKDPLENFKVLASHDVPPKEVAMTLIGIKVNRLKNLLLTQKEPLYESLEDTILDLANYAALLHAVVNEPMPLLATGTLSVSTGLGGTPAATTGGQ